MRNYILVTGGHHSSAVPLIKLFLKDNFKVVFMGHKYASVLNNYVSSEYKEITALGIKYVNLSTSKFYGVKGIKKYFKILYSIFWCLTYLTINRPKLVLSYGGYLAVPVVIAAKILFIKVYTHEQTLTLGLANKLIQHFAKVIFVSWPESVNKNKKSKLVGLPLREEIINANIKKLGPNYSFKTIYIQGGKQGSHELNNFVFKNIDYLCKNFIIYHQTSKHSANTDYEQAKALSKKYKNYHPFEFIYGKDYTELLNKSDLILSRSGAHIVYEVSYLKIPTIFVPLPFASQNEQYKNAVNAQNYLPCEVIEQKNLNIKSFVTKINSLLLKSKQVKTYNNVESDSTNIMYKVICSDLK